MKNRERGTGVCRFNTLHGRWFGKSDKLCAQISDGNTESIIKWGSILTLKNKKGYFLVYEVWKIMGNKKQYPSEYKDVLIWPFVINIKGLKKYRLGVRHLAYNKENNTVGYMGYGVANEGNVEDGKNVRASYKLIKDVTTVMEVNSKIDI